MSVLAGRRILVVEDEAIVAAMIEDMLSSLGATVAGPAFTLEKGVRLAETEAFDAALLDVNIRGATVDPIVLVLKRRRIPVVFATGYGSTASAVTSGNPVLDKPYTKERLAEELGRVLRLPPTGS